MPKTTVHLTDLQKLALARTVELTGRTEADLIREAVDAVTARYPPREPRLPLFVSGRNDVAEQAEQLLDRFGES